MDTEDGSDDEFIDRTPVKRKVTGAKNEPPKGKLVEGSGTEDSELALDLKNESDDEFIIQGDRSRVTQEASPHGTARVIGPAYSWERIRTFLRVTKGQWAVRVEEHFPDLSLFQDAVRLFLRGKGDDGSAFTDQKTYCLKKMLVKVRSQLENAD